MNICFVDNIFTLPAEVFSSCLAIVSAVMVSGLFLWPALQYGTGYQTIWEIRPSAETLASFHWRRFYFQLTRVHSASELFGRCALQIYLLTYFHKKPHTHDTDLEFISSLCDKICKKIPLITDRLAAYVHLLNVVVIQRATQRQHIIIIIIGDVWTQIRWVFLIRRLTADLLHTKSRRCELTQVPSHSFNSLARILFLINVKRH